MVYDAYIWSSSVACLKRRKKNMVDKTEIDLPHMKSHETNLLLIVTSIWDYLVRFI